MIYFKGLLPSFTHNKSFFSGGFISSTATLIPFNQFIARVQQASSQIDGETRDQQPQVTNLLFYIGVKIEGRLSLFHILKRFSWCLHHFLRAHHKYYTIAKPSSNLYKIIALILLKKYQGMCGTFSTCYGVGMGVALDIYRDSQACGVAPDCASYICKNHQPTTMS